MHTCCLSALPGLGLDEAWTVRQQRERSLSSATASDAGEAAKATETTEVTAFLRRRWLRTARESYLSMAQVLVSADDRVDELVPLLAAVPVLVAHGAADDAWSPAQQADMAQRLRANYVVIEDAGHSPAYEAPGSTADLLERHFSSGTGSSPPSGLNTPLSGSVHAQR